MPNPWDEGTKIYGRAKTDHANTVGVATGHTRECQLEGCRGVRVRVKWPDGHITLPCTKGLTAGPEPDTFRIE